MDDSRQRVRLLRRRVIADPASVLFVGLSEEYRRLGQLRDAIEVAEAGLRHHPTYTAGRLSLARAFAQLGRYHRARRELDHLLAIAPDNLAALRLLASLCEQHGALEEARVHHRTIADLVPDDTESRLALETLEHHPKEASALLPFRCADPLGQLALPKPGLGPPASPTGPPAETANTERDMGDDWDYGALDRFVRSNEVNRRV